MKIQLGVVGFTLLSEGEDWGPACAIKFDAESKKLM